MKLHVKVGTHPAYFADVVRKKKPPKIGASLELKDEQRNGKPIRVCCHAIKNLGNDDILYFMERM